MEGTPVKYMPVTVSEFCDNKLKYMESMKEYLISKLPDQKEDSEGYVTIGGDGHISDKIYNMLEQSCYRVYLSGESKLLEPYRKILESKAAQGIKIVILTNPPFSMEKAKIYLSERKPGQIGIIVDSETVLTGDVGNGEQSACLYSGKKNLVDLFKDSLSNEIKLIELTERK